nr:restriction endonuclease [uncultured Dongia sp.]
MAEITRRRTGELLRALFAILEKHPDGLPARVALQQLVDAVTLSEYEAGTYESTGARRFEKIVRFATVDCSKAGWLTKHKGTWFATDAGLSAYKAFRDPEAFYKEAVRLYRVWKASQPSKEDSDTVPSDDGPNESSSAAITFEQAEEQAWAEISRHLSNMPPYEFQDLVADLLRAMGYHVSWVSPPGKDGGVDIIAYTDPLGAKPPRIKVQVKRVAQKVDKDGLKSFLAIVNDHDVGLFVSTAGFTRDAEDFARSQERRQITLIDSERLFDLWTQHFAHLSDSARARLPLTPIYFLTPKN